MNIGDELQSPEGIAALKTEEGWERLRHHRISLAEGDMVVVELKYGTNAAGLVFLAQKGDAYRVVGTYIVVQGGLGTDMFLRGTWVTPDQRAVILFYYIARYYRGFWKDDDTRIGPQASQEWVAIGLSRERAWVAAPRVQDVDSVRQQVMDHELMRFEKRGSGLRLTGCEATQTAGIVRDFDPLSMMFGAPRHARLVCPIRQEDLERPEWQRPEIEYPLGPVEMKLTDDP